MPSVRQNDTNLSKVKILTKFNKMRTFYPVYVRYALYMYNLSTEGKYSGAKLLDTGYV